MESSLQKFSGSSAVSLAKPKALDSGFLRRKKGRRQLGDGRAQEI